MSNLEKFVKELGLSKAQIEKLTSDGEVNVGDIVEEFNSERKKYYSKAHQDEISDLKSQNLRDKINFKKGVAKALGYNYTNSQLDDFKDMDDFYKDISNKSSSEKKSLLENADGELKTRLENLTKDHQALQSTLEEQVGAVRSEYQAKERERSTQDNFTKLFDSIKDEVWDDPKKGKGVYREILISKIRNEYDVKEDMSIFDKKGGPAKHPSGKSLKAETVNDILGHYMEANHMTRKSNGGQGGSGEPVTMSKGGKVINTDKLSENQKRMLERNQQAKERQAQRSYQQ